MNIDDLKDAWGKDEPAGMQLPDSKALLGKTTSVVDRIRKSMKGEFIATIVSYVLLLLYVIFLRGRFNAATGTVFFLNTSSILLFIMVVLNGYFFARFYIFYRTISRYDLSITNSIRKIAYELELNTEIYKTYSFCVVPLAVLITATLVGGKKVFSYMGNILSSQGLFSGQMLWVFSVIAIGFIITYFCINVHVRQQYGKYIGELKLIMDDLGTQSNDL